VPAWGYLRFEARIDGPHHQAFACLDVTALLVQHDAIEREQRDDHREEGEPDPCWLAEQVASRNPISTGPPSPAGIRRRHRADRARERPDEARARRLRAPPAMLDNAVWPEFPPRGGVFRY
jgi:hypothetical protein